MARGKDYAAIAASAIAKIGGMGQFVSKGSKVVIKPNIGWDRTPNSPPTPTPKSSRRSSNSASTGAAKVQVFDRCCNDPRRCYTNSGILAAIESLKDDRATCPFVEDRKFIPVKIEHGKAVTEWNLYRDALEADCYINVPHRQNIMA